MAILTRTWSLEEIPVTTVTPLPDTPASVTPHTLTLRPASRTPIPMPYAQNCPTSYSLQGQRTTKLTHMQPLPPRPLRPVVPKANRVVPKDSLGLTPLECPLRPTLSTTSPPLSMTSSTPSLAPTSRIHDPKYSNFNQFSLKKSALLEINKF